LKLTAQDLVSLGVVDEVVQEPEGGAHRDWDTACENVKRALLANLEQLTARSSDELRNERYAKFRKLGRFAEANASA
jgi:acetyl-CoA carboxylase carboxyl transferase subunit alpha